MNPDTIVYPWDTPQHNYHNTRVLCDQAGLSVEEKNTICKCIYQESQFFNYLPNGTPVKCVNKLANGSVGSTDWGIVQVNDYYHVGAHKDFPSISYVMQNPGKAVAWMITMYKHGLLKQWVSYSSGAYLKWGAADSPMWKLALTN